MSTTSPPQVRILPDIRRTDGVYSSMTYMDPAYREHLDRMFGVGEDEQIDLVEVHADRMRVRVSKINPPSNSDADTKAER